MGEWECTACGYVEIGETAPARCPDCGAPQEKFECYSYEDDVWDEELNDDDEWEDEWDAEITAEEFSERMNGESRMNQRDDSWQG